MKQQKEIFQAVVARGYMNGWLLRQFAARQILKLVEEVAEVVEYLVLDESKPDAQTFRESIAAAGQAARRLFDQSPADRPYFALDYDNVKDLLKEAADVQVILCCLVESINRDTWLGFDIMGEAHKKAVADISRGVRGKKL